MRTFAQQDETEPAGWQETPRERTMRIVIRSFRAPIAEFHRGGTRGRILITFILFPRAPVPSNFAEA